MPKDVSAPHSLELVRAFVNSVDLEHPEEDALRDLDSARGWLKTHALSSRIEEEDLPTMRDLREKLRAALLEHGSGGRSKASRVLWEALDGAGLRLSLDAAGEPGLSAAMVAGLEALRGAIAGAVYDARVRGTWPRLKACQKSSCYFAFYDHSKNGSGAWCSMEGCGNRVKAERRRARERAMHSD